MSDSLATPWTVARLLRPWDSPGKNTGVGCYFLLQRIFPTQGLKPRSPGLQADPRLGGHSSPPLDVGSPVACLWRSFPALLPVDVWGVPSLRVCGRGCATTHVLGEQTHTSLSPEYLRGDSQGAPSVGNTRLLCKAVTAAGTWWDPQRLRYPLTLYPQPSSRGACCPSVVLICIFWWVLALNTFSCSMPILFYQCQFG